jgi:hypothetical protein
MANKAVAAERSTFPTSGLSVSIFHAGYCGVCHGFALPYILEDSRLICVFRLGRFIGLSPHRDSSCRRKHEVPRFATSSLCRSAGNGNSDTPQGRSHGGASCQSLGSQLSSLAPEQYAPRHFLFLCEVLTLQLDLYLMRGNEKPRNARPPQPLLHTPILPPPKFQMFRCRNH